MRIGIDARFYGPFGKGLGRYTQKLVDYLAKIDQANDYVIFIKKENWDDFNTTNSKFTKVLADYRWYTLSEQINMPLVIKKAKIDLMHFPHFNVPIFYTGKFVVTIHDLIITSFPTRRASTLGPILYKIKQWGYQIVVNSAVRRANKIITVSNYSKKEILKNFKVSADKIAVTYEAVNGLSERRETDSGNQEEITKKYQLRKPYLLYVGNAYPHKNLRALIKVFKELKKQNIKLFLTLVGKEDYFFERLKEGVRESELGDLITFPGFVSDEDLLAFYHQALAYIFPSFCEGFGLPPLEAMALGCPVICANSSCLPEILQDSALYFDPHEINGIIEAVKKVYFDRHLREELARKGLNHVQKFSWTKMAKETLAIYDSVTSCAAGV